MNSLRKFFGGTHLNFVGDFPCSPAMNTGRYILSQIIELVERKTLSRLVARYGAEERVRHFKCLRQFICMVFAQMTSRDGLRDIATCLNARPKALYHLCFAEKVAKLTLAEANENRDWRIWEDLAMSLMRKARPLYAGEDLGIDLTIRSMRWIPPRSIFRSLFSHGRISGRRKQESRCTPRSTCVALFQPASTLLERASTTWDAIFQE
jgi:hypothetical protein